MNDLIKHEKQVVVESFDGKLYFTAESNHSALKKALNENRFVELNGELLNTSTIKRVYLSESEGTLDQDQKQALEQRKKEFKLNLGRLPNREEVTKMILKIKGN